MIRKGRPASDVGRNVRRDAGGLSDGESRRSSRVGLPAAPPSAASPSPQPAEEPFDPFESFDEHDRAAGFASSRERGSRGGGAFARPQGPQGDTSAEVVYTRSRRTRDATASTDKARISGAVEEDSARSKRPVRSLKSRALGYLSRREYSRAELGRKLMPFADEASPLEALLDTLEKEGWLSDSRFAESLVHRRASRVGTSRIVNELKRHAVSQTLIEETGAQLRETELARAQAVWRKKYGELPQTPAERARQARFLAARGFSQSIIGKILKGIDDDWIG